MSINRSLCLGLLLVLGSSFGQIAGSAPKTITINGYVLDSACAFTKHLTRPVSSACAVACAKAGSPLVILASDGKLYLPISDTTPAQGQNERLLKFAGKKVKVTGMLYSRNGAFGLVIEKIAGAGP